MDDPKKIDEQPKDKPLPPSRRKDEADDQSEAEKELGPFVYPPVVEYDD